MAQFITRIELDNNATSDNYTKLHYLMAKAGFKKTISNGVNNFKLPTAEYFIEADVDVAKICTLAETVTKQVDDNYKILVSEAVNLKWILPAFIGKG